MRSIFYAPASSFDVEDWYFVWCKHVGRVGLYAGIFLFLIFTENNYKCRPAKIDSWHSFPTGAETWPRYICDR